MSQIKDKKISKFICGEVEDKVDEKPHNIKVDKLSVDEYTIRKRIQSYDMTDDITGDIITGLIDPDADSSTRNEY
jgi:hypothetical protein